MAEEEKKAECKTDGCKHTACAMAWLKQVDDWSIGGWMNPFPGCITWWPAWCSRSS